MKKLVLAGVAAAALCGGAASAADLPRRAAPPPAPVVALPLFTWTGFYIGANAGAAWSNNSNNGVGAFAPAGTFAAAGPAFAATTGTFGFAGSNGRRTGFEYGAQVGYNWQVGSFVLGAEADINGITGNRRSSFGAVAAAPTFTGAGPLPAGLLVANGGLNSVDWYGTVRARAGFAVDRALIYGTGGLAYGGGSNNGFCGAFNCGSNTRTGYTLGAGVEYAFTNNLSAKLEYLYVNLGNRRSGGATYSAPTNTVFVSNNRNRNDFSVVRAGLNWRFSL